jgi:hypothetical protein
MKELTRLGLNLTTPEHEAPAGTETVLPETPQEFDTRLNTGSEDEIIALTLSKEELPELVSVKGKS